MCVCVFCVCVCEGYFTKYDCSSADINPIGSLSKRDVMIVLFVGRAVCVCRASCTSWLLRSMLLCLYFSICLEIMQKSMASTI